MMTATNGQQPSISSFATSERTPERKMPSQDAQSDHTLERSLSQNAQNVEIDAVYTLPRSLSQNAHIVVIDAEHTLAKDLSFIAMDSPASDCSINTLPDELLLRIFSFFSHKELYRTLAPVCRDWRTLARDPTLWRRVFLNMSNNSLDLFFNSRPPLSLTVEVRLGRWLWVDKVILLVCEHCPRLEAFLGSYMPNRFCIEPNLFKLSQTHPRLKRLKILVGDQRPAKYMPLARFTQLVELDFGSSYDEVDEKTLIAIATSCTELVSLKVGAAGSTDAFVHVLSASLRQLSTLHLSARKLTDKACAALVQCRKLGELKMYGAFGISAVGLLRILSSKSLTNVVIASAKSVPVGSIKPHFSASSPSNVQRIFLNGCDILTDDLLSQVAAVCRHSLVEVDIAECPNISDHGVDRLFRSCSLLESVSLFSNRQLTPACLDALLLDPPVLPHLRLLYFPCTDEAQSDAWLEKLNAIKLGTST